MKRYGIFALLLAAGLLFASVASATDVSRRLFDREQLQVSTGTATITSTAADFTTWQRAITIVPDANHALYDVVVVIDLDKATTGFTTAYTTGTIVFSTGRKIDGTNWRVATNLITTAISGDNSDGLSIELNLGNVDPTESVGLYWKVSAESNTNASFPYTIHYRAGVRATITPAS